MYLMRVNVSLVFKVLYAMVLLQFVPSSLCTVIWLLAKISKVSAGKTTRWIWNLNHALHSSFNQITDRVFEIPSFGVILLFILI